MALTNKRIVAGKAYGKIIYYFPTGRIKYSKDLYQYEGYFADENYLGQLTHRFFVKNQKELIKAIQRGKPKLQAYYESEIKRGQWY